MPVNKKRYQITLEVCDNNKYKRIDWLFDNDDELRELCKQLKLTAISEIRIKLLSTIFSEKTPEIILDTITLTSYNSNLAKINAPKDFFSPEQDAKIKTLLENNIREIKRAQSKSLDWNLFIGASSLFLAFYFRRYSVVLGIFTGLALKFFKQAWDIFQKPHKEEAKARYDSPEKIKELSHPEEIEALKIGVQAKFWGGYVNSFLSLPPFRFKQAFDAGMTFAEQENQDIVDEILTKKIKPTS